MSNETDLDWLARNVHVWPANTPKVIPPEDAIFKLGAVFYGDCIAFSGKLEHEYRRVNKADWLARRAKLQNKPSWVDAPEWAEWLAQDEDGEWKWLAGLPGKYVDGWTAVKIKGCCKGIALGDWRDTLEKRPEEFKQFISIEDNQEKDMKQDNGWFEREEVPPVGSSVTVVEVDGLGLSDLGREFVGEECKVMATFTRPELSHSDAVDVVVVMEHGGGCCCFVLEMIRPIRTERDVLIEIIKQWDGLVQTDDVLADAILAAGFKCDGGEK